MIAVDASPAQRAFAAASEAVRDDYVRALERAMEARRVLKAAQHELNVSVAELQSTRGEVDVKALDRAVEARRVFKAAANELNVAVAELRTFHGEIDDQVAA